MNNQLQDEGMLTKGGYISKALIFSLALFAIFAVGLFNLLLRPAPATAQSSSSDPTINQLLQDPNARVIVRNATISPSPTQEAPVLQSASAEPAATDQVTIVVPQEGDVLLDTNLSISGRSPPGVIINLNIHDDDLNVDYIKQSVLPNALGSTTSDQAGNWVFIPKTRLELGKYWVQASFTDAQKGTLTTPQVHFTVANILGKTQTIVFYRSIQFWLILLLLTGLIIMAGLWLYFYKNGRYFPFKHKKPGAGPVSTLSSSQFNQPSTLQTSQPDQTNQPNQTNPNPAPQYQNQPQFPPQDSFFNRPQTPNQFVQPESTNSASATRKSEEKGRLENLQRQVSQIKNSLLETAESISRAGRETEAEENKIREDLKSNESDRS